MNLRIEIEGRPVLEISAMQLLMMQAMAGGPVLIPKEGQRVTAVAWIENQATISETVTYTSESEGEEE